MFFILNVQCSRAETFRSAFKELHTLRTFFPGVPLLALSGTLTEDHHQCLKERLGLHNHVVVHVNPDRPNIFLSIGRRSPGQDVIQAFQDLYEPEFTRLAADAQNYPVTLMYLPLPRTSEALALADYIFGEPSLETTRFAAIFSNQDKEVIAHVTQELKKDVPHVRLILCTSCIGMGFDSPSIQRVIHLNPPRNICNYFQEVGRAGRSGSPAEAKLYFTARDIAKNVTDLDKNIVLYCQATHCLRETLLNSLGSSKYEASPSGCRCCSLCTPACDCDACLVTVLEETMLT